MNKTHRYQLHLKWTGNLGEGTKSYAAYSRDHEISAAGKTVSLPGSSDPAFRGDAARYNPEELLVSALSGCHMLWFLHLCSQNGITVSSYEDEPEGIMEEEPNGAGQFSEVILHPKVVIREQDKLEAVSSLHQQAHALCFIARSVNFPVVVR